MYPTLEHAFQAAKSTSPTVRKMFLWPQNNDPSAAKRMGQQLQVRPGWTELRVKIMRDLLKIKFSKHVMRKMLLDTGYDVELIEGNTWGDQFWGAVKQSNGTYVGENMLGKLLMQLRKELFAEDGIEVSND